MLPTTRPLSPIPSIIPASSIFQRFSGLIILMQGRVKFWNHFLITLVVAPFTRVESIWNCFLVLRIGFRLKKLLIYRLPRGLASPLAYKIRPTKILIWP
jgi:hypothetical protein